MPMMKKFAAAALLAAAAPGEASETVTYSYDPLGRLVNVARSVGANTPVVTRYTLDPAGNRLSHSVDGGSLPPVSNSRRTVVVPLLGLEVIPLPN
jgi:hypothetical protein